MQTWQVGDVRITRIKELEFPIIHGEGSILPDASAAALQEIPWLQPHFVNDQWQMLLSIHALLVVTPKIRLVVDTCIGNDKPRAFIDNKALQTRFLERFLQSGYNREQVSHVVCTHLHVDHVGWNTMLQDDRWLPTFPNARYLLGKQEYAFWSKHQDPGQQTIMADSIQPVFDAGLVDLVDMDHKLCEEIDLVPTPGHTPGHVSVRIRSQGRQAIITGDCIHHPAQMARPHWCVRFDQDQKAAASMRKQLLAAWADHDTLVIGTHFAAPTAGYVKSDGSAYRFNVD